jgi:hypothetical protein
LELLMVLLCSRADAQLSVAEAESAARGYTLRLDTGAKQLTAVVVQHSDAFVALSSAQAIHHCRGVLARERQGGRQQPAPAESFRAALDASVMGDAILPGI